MQWELSSHFTLVSYFRILFLILNRYHTLQIWTLFFEVRIYLFILVNQSKGIIIRVLALVARLGVGVGWSAFELMSSESYPTVIR